MFRTITRDAPVGSLRLVTVVGTYVTADYGSLDILTSYPEQRACGRPAESVTYAISELAGSDQ
jgi:hypothetical protein